MVERFPPFPSSPGSAGRRRGEEGRPQEVCFQVCGEPSHRPAGRLAGQRQRCQKQRDPQQWDDQQWDYNQRHVYKQWHL